MAKTININYITKIEGHARLHIKIDKGKIKRVALNIFEGARFFEGILKGKKYNDMADISSRICGVCSVVHTLTSLKAIENAFNIKISHQTATLRELLSIGGIIQSHALHLYFMVLPDYLGYPNAIKMASQYKEEFKRALRLKKAGNDIVRTIGGRDVHPIAAVIGGFTRLPEKQSLGLLLKNLKEAKKDALETLRLFSKLEYPKFDKFSEYFALEGISYFSTTDQIACKGNTCIPVNHYENHFKEYFKQGSTSEFAAKGQKSYMVGALARIINNRALLSKESLPYFKIIKNNIYNPHMNVLAQAIEIYEGIRRCIEILEGLELEEEKLPEIKPRKAVGFGASEAPRGLLFHKYEFDSSGFSTFVNITTPTTQNLQNMEDNIKWLLPSILDKSKEEIRLEIEKLIRAYDPCISCATHFLEVVWG
jgi:coenzyme F420-reducing hydrogenase alpha subunit